MAQEITHASSFQPYKQKKQLLRTVTCQCYIVSRKIIGVPSQGHPSGVTQVICSSSSSFSLVLSPHSLFPSLLPSTFRSFSSFSSHFPSFFSCLFLVIFLSTFTGSSSSSSSISYSSWAIQWIRIGLLK